ncbi:hypothetical protein M1O29_03040, partial [Dehalococcoidia bacterium]|nr:hypothetical protein [Dehalococcoidia bacterium]
GPVCELCEAGDQCQLVLKRSVSEIVDSVGALVDLCGFQEVALEWTGAIDSEWLGGVVRAIRARYPVDDLGLVVAELPLDDYSLTVGNLLGESVIRRGYPVPLLTVNEGRWSVAACTSAQFDLISALEKIFEREWNGLSFRVKVGGPGETEDDIRNLVELVSETARVGQRMLGKRPKLRMELDLFSPRAHHQFEAAALNNLDEITNKMDILRHGLRKVGATVICPDPFRWLVQSSLRRGDRRVGKVIHRAWELGCSLESRGQRFDLGRWRQAFEESNLELEVYGCRPYFTEGDFPWSHLDFSQRRAILG